MVPKLRAEGANVKVFDTLSVYTDEKLMAETDLIIQIWTMGKITEKQFEGLEKAIMNGTGFAGWHGGLGDAFRDNLKYQFIVGGQFLFHPGGHIDHSIKIIDKSDPITQGLKDFNLKKKPNSIICSLIPISRYWPFQNLIGKNTKNLKKRKIK